jgi:hypothetical protein
MRNVVLPYFLEEWREITNNKILLKILFPGRMSLAFLTDSSGTNIPQYSFSPVSLKQTHMTTAKEHTLSEFRI